MNVETLKADVRLATAKRRKVEFMLMWMAANYGSLNTMTTKQLEDFCLEYFGSKSYATEVGYFRRIGKHISIRADWRESILNG